MSDDIRLTRDIHAFFEHLDWEEQLALLEEIVDSDEWKEVLEMDMMIYEVALYQEKNKLKDSEVSL